MAEAAPAASVIPETSHPEGTAVPIKSKAKSNSIPGDFPNSLVEEDPPTDYHMESPKPWLIAHQQGTLGSKTARPFEAGFYSKTQYEADAVLFLAFVKIRESRKNQPAKPGEGYLKLLIPHDSKIAKALVSTWSKKKIDKTHRANRDFLPGGKRHNWLTGGDFAYWLDRFRSGPINNATPSDLEAEDEEMSEAELEPAQSPRKREGLRIETRQTHSLNINLDPAVDQPSTQLRFGQL
jgi:hypothetical protein